MKLFNHRPILFLFMSIIVGFWLGKAFCLSQTAIVVAILIVLLIIFIIVNIIAFKGKKIEFVSKHKLTIGICIIAVFISFVAVNVSIENYNRGNRYTTDQNITGTVESVGSGYYVIGNTNINSKIKVYTQDDLPKVGDTVSLTGVPEKYIYDGSTDNNIINDVGYKLILQSPAAYTQSSIGASLDVKVRTWVKETLYNNLSPNAAGIMYAMFFGDKTDLDSGLYNQFSISGIAHVLAVSGLHVGLIVFLLLLCVRKVPNRHKIFFAPALVFYCWLCGWYVSVVRASIMAVVMLLARSFGKQYDTLSSLAMAGIVIFAIFPLTFLDFRFWLSFMSVLGIIVLYKPFSKFFMDKCKIPKIISNGLALTFAAQIFTLPITVSVFKSVSLLGFLTNIIALPIVSLGFYAMVVLCLVCAVLPFMAFAFFIVEACMQAVMFLSGSIAGVSFASVKVLPFSAFFVVCFYLFFVVSSRFIFGQQKIKDFITYCLIGVVAFGTVFANVSFYQDGVMCVIKGDYGVTAVVRSGNSYNLFVVDSIDTYNVIKYLDSQKIKTIDNIVFASATDISNLDYFKNYMKVKKVYTPNNYNKDFNVGKISVRMFDGISNHLGIYIKYKKGLIAFLAGTGSGPLYELEAWSDLKGIVFNVAIVKYGDSTDAQVAKEIANYVVCGRIYGESNVADIINIHQFGNWTFRF